VVKILKKTGDIAKITMLIVGAVIGAGFASGREIAEMLYSSGAAAYHTVIAITLCVAIICILIMWLGKRILPKNVSDFHVAIFKKSAPIIDIMVLANCFIVLSAMVAGLSGVAMSIGVVGYVIVPLACVIAVFAVLKKDISRVIKVNLIIMPVIIAIIIIVALPNAIGNGGVLTGRLRLIPSLIYVGMNLILTVGALIRAYDIEFKVMIIGAILAGIIIGGLVWVMLAAISANPSVAETPMPLFALAMGSGWLTNALRISMMLSIFTSVVILLQTIVDWLQGIIKNRFFAAAIIIVLAFLFSLIGFTNIVAWFYPIAGVFGIVYLAWLCGYGMIIKAKNNREMKPTN